MSFFIFLGFRLGLFNFLEEDVFVPFLFLISEKVVLLTFKATDESFQIFFELNF